MKTGKYINILYIMMIGLLFGCTEYPAYEITNPPFVNSSDLEMYVDSTMQLTASPADGKFTWSSDNTEIVSVNSTGLVTAVGEGLATITIASDNAETKIDVRVRKFIHLTDITLPESFFQLRVGDEAQVWAYSVPEDASEVTFTWLSENPSIATVDEKGKIKITARGETNIIVKFGSVEKTISVEGLAERYMCDKTGWKVLQVSDADSEGGGKDMIIDGSYNGGEFWHSNWHDASAILPHWAIIDMIDPVEIIRIVTQRRSNGDTKTVQYYIGDSPDPDGEWELIAEGDVFIDHILILDLEESRTSRYLKLKLEDSNRPPHTAICEVDVYGLRD